MYSKKGVSGHIEVIISFLIFLAFVSFLLFFVNPIEKNKETAHYLEIAENAITERIKGNLSEFSITLNVAPAAAGCACFDYNNPPYKISHMAGNDIVIKTKDGIITPGAKIGNKICFEPVVVGVAGERFYRLYFSEEFEGAAGALCGATPPVVSYLSSSDYTLGVYNAYEKISNKSLYSLNEDYKNDYTTLRNTLNLNADFNIFVKDMKNDYLAYGKIREPKGSNIMAKETPIEIINETGGVIPAIMNIQVWE